MTQSAPPHSRLVPSLSSLETWGFGLTGLLLWLGVAPEIQLALGWQALWIWMPGSVIGILINLQVQQLGKQWQDLSGGTPSYLSRLLPESPWLATYGAMGYYISWVAVLPVNAILLTELVQANLAPFGITGSTMLLKIGFTAIAFLVAFSGTRALGVLHLFFVVPAISLLLVFCIQGLGWIAITDTPTAIALVKPDISSWAKWYVVASYAVYACETGSAFVADSRDPQRTLQVLPVAASLIPLVYLAGSWILLELGSPEAAILSPYEQLIAASPFWGQGAAFIVTFLLASASLLSCATAVSNTPRMLYQLSLDGQLPPIFAQSSKRGILGAGLLLTLILSLAFLLWGDITQIVFVTGIGWLCSFAIFHWGLWRQRQQSYVLWPMGSLCFAAIELLAVIAGGIAWNWRDLILGLLIPLAAWLIFQGVGQAVASYWEMLGQKVSLSQRVAAPDQDWALLQIAGLIGLLSGAISLSWLIHGYLAELPQINQANILVVVLLIGTAGGVAIAGWTTLPQIAAIGDARQQAEQFFNAAADGILTLDAEGKIQQANQASQVLFGLPSQVLVGQSLYCLLPDLLKETSLTVPCVNVPLKANLSGGAVEVTISPASQRVDQDQRMEQYVAVIRDITERQAAEDTLRQKASELQLTLDQLTQAQSQLVQAEKMSGLGQLMAGVAHEINNPLSFIAGNVEFARSYALDLMTALETYQRLHPSLSPELNDTIDRLDLAFVREDFPKLLTSMEDGVERILKIVQSLKTFSRHDEAPSKAVNLSDGLKSTLVILKNRLKANGRRPEIQIIQAMENLPLVECFPSGVNQVFMNLLSNAIDALEMVDFAAEDAQPLITIEGRSKSMGDRPGVEIAIADNGPGIPPDKRHLIYDPFFTTKPIGKGTGLGLSISYQIVVERHGGSLQIESEPDAGAKFVIWLPVNFEHSTNRSTETASVA